ncbi:hypothetical protein KAS50_04815 [bacterium]|nr:hypothetical protein [bacterium]
MQEEKNILDYLIVLAKRKGLIITFTVFAAIITITLSLILPKWYRAESVIMPPESESGLLGVSSLLSQFDELPVGGLSLGKTSEKTKRLMTIMESRTIMEKVVKKFDLIKSYKEKNITDTIKRLRKYTTFKIQESDAISFTVIDKSPQKASDMANYFLSEMEKMNIELNIEKARNNRIFVEERYKQNKIDLRNAEEKLKEFMNTHNVVSLPEQTEAAIQAAAELGAEVYRIEIELGIKEKTLGRNHSTISSLKTELKEYQKKLDRLFDESENPAKKEISGDITNLFIPFSKAPEIGVEYIRLKRDVGIQNKIFELLTTLYEQAKIEEAKDTPTIQILDRAVPPEKKYKPRRMILVVFWTSAAVIFSIILAFIFNFIERVSHADNKDYEKAFKLRKLLFKKYNQ